MRGELAACQGAPGPVGARCQAPGVTPFSPCPSWGAQRGRWVGGCTPFLGGRTQTESTLRLSGGWRTLQLFPELSDDTHIGSAQSVCGGTIYLLLACIFLDFISIFGLDAVPPKSHAHSDHYEMPGMEPGLAACRAGGLPSPTVFSSLFIYFF